jgi:hypothetical protein
MMQAEPSLLQAQGRLHQGIAHGFQSGINPGRMVGGATRRGGALPSPHRV